MKILYHHRTLGDGAEGIHIAEMVNAFRQLGHEVLVIGPGVENVNGGEKRTERLTWVKRLFKGPFYELAELGYNFFGYRNICRAILDFQPDFIYDRYITFNYSAIAAGRKFNLPVFLEVNAPLAYEREHEPDEKLYLKWLAYYIEKKACCDAFKTIVVSTPLKDYLLEKGVPEKKIKVLVNGANTDKFFPQEKNISLLEEQGFSENDIVVGFVGILRPWHGIDLLLKAMQKVCSKNADCKLLIVGDGPIRQELEEQIVELKIQDNVVITGRVPHDEICKYISLFDVAVSPKTTFYASPMKILEYMAQSKPVVAPEIPNIRDIVKNRETGLLFVDNDPVSLTEALMELISDEHLRKVIGTSANAIITNRMNWKNNVHYIITEYNGHGATSN